MEKKLLYKLYVIIQNFVKIFLSNYKNGRQFRIMFTMVISGLLSKINGGFFLILFGIFLVFIMITY